MKSRLWINTAAPGIEFADHSYRTHRFKPHFHDHYVFLTAKQGINIGECQRQPYAITPDDVMIINPSEIHTGSSWQEHFLNYTALYVSPAFFHSILKKELLGQEHTTWFTKTVLPDSRLATLLREIVQYSEQEETDLFTEALHLFFAAMMERFTTTGLSASRKQYCRRAIKKGVEFIQQQYAEQVSIENFCHQENISYYSFIRSFKQYTGLTPGQYLINYRVERARELLQRQESLNSVCWDTGFFDQSHFNRHFKFITGMTPGQYSQCFRSR